MLAVEAARRGISADPNYTLKVIDLIRERLVLLTDLWGQSWFFFQRPEAYDRQVMEKIWQPSTAGIIRNFSAELAGVEHFNKDSFHATIQTFIPKAGIKTGQLMNPLRLLVVGSNQGPGMTEIAELLGKEEFLARIYTGLNRLVSDSMYLGGTSPLHS
jgi:glutamyl-tRNA synthetase